MQTPLSPVLLVSTLLIVATVAVIALAAVRRRSRPVRSLAALHAVTDQWSTIAETGRAIHAAPGPNSAALERLPVAETLAGLELAATISDAATRRAGQVRVSSGDAISDAAMRGVVPAAYRRNDLSDDTRFDDRVRLAAHNTPLAYAGALAYTIADPAVAAHVLVGQYGSEVLLATEATIVRSGPLVAGATAATALPVLALSADALVIGEDVFAATAYLRQPQQSRRLQAHDMLRWFVLAALALGIAWQMLALYGIVPGLA